MEDVKESMIAYEPYKTIPYSILDNDLTLTLRNEFFAELSEIKKAYEVYDKGSKFLAEGSNGDYVPMSVRFRKARNIINQIARFMFSQKIDIIVNKDNNGTDEEKEANTIVNEFVQKVLNKNSFCSNLLKAAKDCFIGKRICIVVNFDTETGIKINFLNALEFYYEMVDDELTKLIAFFVEVESSNMSEKVVRKKTYEMSEDGYCYVEDALYDGSGKLLDEPEIIKTKLTSIPAWIVLNDGLVNDKRGESDILQLIDEEQAYSKMANGDMDSERKNMNPVKYTIDASSESTENLSSGAGAYWDIQSDENGVEQKRATVGQLESAMSYTNALSVTLQRIEDNMYSSMSVPNITSEKLQGMITSGKTIQALYYPLQIRSDEKMQVWIPAIVSMVEMIYEGAIAYPETITKYIVESLPRTNIEVHVEANYAIPEDEFEEKAIDLQEINAQTMSRKSYMKKWRGLTDEEADEELRQIALEREMLEDSYSGMNQSNDFDNEDIM